MKAGPPVATAAAAGVAASKPAVAVNAGAEGRSLYGLYHVIVICCAHCKIVLTIFR